MDSTKQSPTLLSLCTGYGGLERGLELVGIQPKVLAHVEIEAFAVANLVAKMEDGSLDPAPIWTDVKTLPMEPFRDRVDILTGGYPCFTEDACVLTSTGYKPIQEVSVGDSVLSHTGTWQRVTTVMCKENARVFRVKFNGGTDLLATGGHPFLARSKGKEWDNEKRTYSRVFSKPGWKTAKNLTQDCYLGQVLPPVGEDSHSTFFWWVVGRFLADGWTQKAPSTTCGRVNICCAREEAGGLEKRIKAGGFKAYRSEERTTTRFTIVKKDFYNFCLQFGAHAHGKYLPGFCLELPQEKARLLFEGYLSGDGHYSKNPRGRGHNWRVTSVSKSLAHGFALLAQRAFGVIAGVRVYTPKRVCVIEGRHVNERTRYIVDIPEQNKEAFIEGKYAWKPVRAVTAEGRATVYNISVEEDESYIVNGAIVHNCQPFSYAGKRKGAEDPRHLWPAFLRLIDGIKPKMCFFENVAGHISLGLREVLSDLESRGYETTWGIFSAAEVGAPHQRKRVFILAHARFITEGGEKRRFDHPGDSSGDQEGVGTKTGDGFTDRCKKLACANDQRLVDWRTSRLSPESACGSCWPARPGEVQHDWEEPRTAGNTEAKPGLGGTADGAADRVDPIAHRVDQLRLLGNGVVPQTAALAWVVLSRHFGN